MLVLCDEMVRTQTRALKVSVRELTGCNCTAGQDRAAARAKAKAAGKGGTKQPGVGRGRRGRGRGAQFGAAIVGGKAPPERSLQIHTAHAEARVERRKAE